MKHVGTVTDISYVKAKWHKGVGLERIYPNNDIRIYSDEVPMADIAEFKFRQGARAGRYDLKTTNKVIRSFNDIRKEWD